MNKFLFLTILIILNLISNSNCWIFCEEKLTEKEKVTLFRTMVCDDYLSTKCGKFFKFGSLNSVN